MNLDKYTFPTKAGQLLSTQTFPNGNMVRSTAELIILTKGKCIDGRIRYIFGLMDCNDNLSGIYSRYPDRLENTQVDDYLVAGSRNELEAQSILACARANFGCSSVDGNWSWKQFIFRYQGMWQHLRIIAKEDVGLLGQAIWAANLAFICAQQPITNQDNWLLSHLMVITYERSGFKSWICDSAIKYWRSKKTKPSYQIMSEYLGPDCQDHPLIEAWRPYD